MNGAPERVLGRLSSSSGAAIRPLRLRLSRRGERTGPAVLGVGAVSGGASFGRGADPDEWRPATVGTPVSAGDRLYTARGSRLELRAEEFEIHLGSATGLEAIDLGVDGRLFSVWGGAASFHVRQLRPGDRFGVETPDSEVTFESAGEYEIDVGKAGTTSVVVRSGSALVSSAGVAVTLRPSGISRA